MKIRKQCSLFLLLAVSLWACDPPIQSTDEKYREDQLALIENIGHNIILQGYRNMESEASLLLEKVQAFNNAPSDLSLLALREQWLAAYKMWQHVGFYQFGPAETYGLINLNKYPANDTLIDRYVLEGIYSLEAASSTFARGFPAMDYILFGYKATDQELIDAIASDANLAKYLLDAATDIHTQMNLVLQQWDPAQGDYVSVFISNPGTSVGSSISQLVNAWSKYLELHIRNAKVAIPNGNSLVTAERFGPFPEKAEAYYSNQYSVILLREALVAFRSFYLGDSADGGDGLGLYEYLKVINAQNGTLADDYLAVMDSAIQEASEISDPYTDQILNNEPEVTDIFNALKVQVALLKVDMVSSLSISLTYADNDGD